VQQLLVDLGFLPVGEDDGVYGPKTSQAVAAFQQTRWLEVDGSWGRASDGMGFPVGIHGVDYSWADPDPGMMATRGVNLAGRYLWDKQHPGSKGITLAEYDALIVANITPFFIYEEDGKELAGGFDAGVRVAKLAEAELAHLHLSGLPVYFNVDYDAPASAMPAILDALRGVASVIGLERTGLYAGLRPITAAFDAGVIAYGFQTYAWSGGVWDARAQLQQWANGQWSGSVDFTRSMVRDFGQYPIESGQ
jgi:peptidoglycan hydrolase-like protein with peptidoglycan-binding domain